MVCPLCFLVCPERFSVSALFSGVSPGCGGASVLFQSGMTRLSRFLQVFSGVFGMLRRVRLVFKSILAEFGSLSALFTGVSKMWRSVRLVFWYDQTVAFRHWPIVLA